MKRTTKQSRLPRHFIARNDGDCDLNKKMQRCVIIGAAPIQNYKKIRSFLHDDDFFIVCDGGLNHLQNLKITPNLIVGDFDSYPKVMLDSSKHNSASACFLYPQVETIVLPCEKDDTDSVFALKAALARGFKDFLFIGMVGARFDHSLANLSLLLLCYEKNLRSLMLDDFSEMQIVGKKNVEISNEYDYFSLITITGKASGITIRNAKYPLENAEIVPSNNQLGISNEVIGEKASVCVKSGILLLVKVWKSI